jgi:hypothetical protein
MGLSLFQDRVPRLTHRLMTVKDGRLPLCQNHFTAARRTFILFLVSEPLRYSCCMCLNDRGSWMDRKPVSGNSRVLFPARISQTTLVYRVTSQNK